MKQQAKTHDSSHAVGTISLLCALIAGALIATGCGGGGGGSAAPTTTFKGRLLLQQTSGNGPAALMSESSPDQEGYPLRDEEPNDQLFSAVDLMGDGTALPLRVAGKTGSSLDRVDIYRFGPFAPAQGLQAALELQFWAAGDVELSCLQGQDLHLANGGHVLQDGQVVELQLRKGEELTLRIEAVAGATHSAATGYRFELRVATASAGQQNRVLPVMARPEPIDSRARMTMLQRGLGAKDSEILPGEVLIKSTGNKSLTAEKMQALGFELMAEGGDVQRWCDPRIVTALSVMDSYEAQLTMANRLRDVRRALSDVAYVSPNLNMPLSGLAKLQGTSSVVEPNDSLYLSNQWNLRLNKFPEAWARTTGSEDVTLAVMDTGLAIKHPDLAARVSPFSFDFVSDIESAGDGDGVDDNPEEPPAIGIKTFYHGTYVTGVLGSVSNNKFGIAAGVWKGKVIALRVIGGAGASSFDRIQAWRYLAGLSNASGKILPVANRPKVLNMSFGMLGISKAEMDEIEILAKTGVICVAAAGNDFKKDSPPVYPAALPFVIGVGAVDINGDVTAYSNGGDFVDLVAAGGVGTHVPTAVTTTWVFEQKNVFGGFEGTSLATPLVCSIIAMMEVIHPGIEKVTVLRAFKESCLDIAPAGRDKESGYGLLDAEKALVRALALDTPPFPEVTPSSFTFFDAQATLELEVKNVGGRVLRGLKLTPKSEVSGGITFMIRHEHAPTIIDVLIDREKVSVGSYNDFYDFRSNGGALLLDLRYRKPIPAPVNELIVRILSGSRLVASTVADAEGEFEFQNIPLGQLTLEAGIDVNDNGKLGDSQEWYINIPINVVVPENPEQRTTLTIPWKN